MRNATHVEVSPSKGDALVELEGVIDEIRHKLRGPGPATVRHRAIEHALTALEKLAVSSRRRTSRSPRRAVLDGGYAFVPDYRDGFVPPTDGDAEASGETFIASATSAEGVAEDVRDEVAEDEELELMRRALSY